MLQALKPKEKQSDPKPKLKSQETPKNAKILPKTSNSSIPQRRGPATRGWLGIEWRMDELLLCADDRQTKMGDLCKCRTPDLQNKGYNDSSTWLGTTTSTRPGEMLQEQWWQWRLITKRKRGKETEGGGGGSGSCMGRRRR